MSDRPVANSSNHEQNRRDFLRMGVLAGVGATVIGSGLVGCASTGTPPGMAATAPEPLTSPPLDRIRAGIIGVGGMGSNHVEHLLNIPGVELKAICDIAPDKVARAQERVVKSGQPSPVGYSRGERDFERMCETEALDIVYIATPWEWHVPMSVAAMKNGKHAATEVPASYTIDGCWQLVEAAEKYRRHCIMLENCCYDRAEMMVLNMARKGVFGELLHAECGYLHDLRGIKFSSDGEGLWRRAHATRRNGNFYPTHGLGPVAQTFNINRGDQFDFLVSMSGPSRGLQLWQEERLAASDSRRAEKYRLGDINLTLIQCHSGKTIYVVHDTNLPRPYSRIFLVQGTRGLYQGYPSRFHIEGRSAEHQWDQGLDKYVADFEHPLWKSEKVKSASSGHGGMDYLESYRIMQCLRTGQPMDMDVYDAAAVSSICELSERSVASRSRSIDVPDFTRGRWKSRAPLGIVEG